jgi:hypothetical protein
MGENLENKKKLTTARKKNSANGLISKNIMNSVRISNVNVFPSLLGCIVSHAHSATSILHPNFQIQPE